MNHEDTRDFLTSAASSNPRQASIRQRSDGHVSLAFAPPTTRQPTPPSAPATSTKPIVVTPVVVTAPVTDSAPTMPNSEPCRDLRSQLSDLWKRTHPIQLQLETLVTRVRDSKVLSNKERSWMLNTLEKFITDVIARRDGTLDNELSIAAQEEAQELMDRLMGRTRVETKAAEPAKASASPKEAPVEIPTAVIETKKKVVHIDARSFDSGEEAFRFLADALGIKLDADLNPLETADETDSTVEYMVTRTLTSESDGAGSRLSLHVADDLIGSICQSHMSQCHKTRLITLVRAEVLKHFTREADIADGGTFEEIETVNRLCDEWMTESTQRHTIH